MCSMSFHCFYSMVLKGYKQPLVQEDMWDLNESDSTAFINERFQHFMKPELDAARVRFQNKMKNKSAKTRDSAQENPQQNGLSSGLGKGVSQDVLMMVRAFNQNHFHSHVHYIELQSKHISLTPLINITMFFF